MAVAIDLFFQMVIFLRCGTSELFLHSNRDDSSEADEQQRGFLLDVRGCDGSIRHSFFDARPLQAEIKRKNPVETICNLKNKKNAIHK